MRSIARILNSRGHATAGVRPHIAWGIFSLLALVFIIYLPLLPGSFLMDDEKLVRWGNPIVNGTAGPFSIWFRGDFALSTFVFWLEWLAWGNNPCGYHLVNMLLHALSAILAWRLLARLGVLWAWLAAALFAVHPVCVASVGRIAELKNTLSLPFFLLSLLFYLRYETALLYPAKQDCVAKSSFWYPLSFGAFVLALLSKTSVVMLPVVLLACAAWQRLRITPRDLLHIAPHFMLALAFGLMSVWFQKYQALAGETLPSQNLLRRLLVAARAFWFYLGKALAPVDLNVIYPRWRSGVLSPASWLPLLLLIGVFLVAWKFRSDWGRHVLFGLGSYAIMLFPALGFFDAKFLSNWQVSDHLQYLPLIAPLALAVAGVARLLRMIAGNNSENPLPGLRQGVLPS